MGLGKIRGGEPMKSVSVHRDFAVGVETTSFGPMRGKGAGRG